MAGDRKGKDPGPPSLSFAAGWAPAPVDLEPPPPGTLRVLPLGGLGEIGKNMMVLHYGQDLVAIDCGLMFPTQHMPGVDFVLPNISYLIRHRDHVRALLLTHGHEDHVGGLPYMWPHLPEVPVFGTALTLGLVRSKLEEFGLSEKMLLRETGCGARIPCGALEAEFFRVVHSISDSVGIAVHTPLGTVVHSGDFKLDETPVDGAPTDRARLQALGDARPLLLFSDSTNAERPGTSSSERVVADALDAAFAGCEGRILITCFASSIPRLQQIVNTAARHGRKVCFHGRSLEANVAVAGNLGYLNVPSDITVRIDEIGLVPDAELVIVATGSQGEPLSAITLMATRRHRFVEIRPGDTVIFSATPVPGNETLVSQVIDQLFRLGANVLYDAHPKSEGMPASHRRIHVSGHASADELQEMLRLVQPRFFVPVHGEYRMLVHHARLAEAVGIPREHIFILEDGDTLDLGPADGEHVPAIRAGRVPAGDVLVDGLSVGDIGPILLRDRNALSQDGICVMVVAIDRTTGEVISGPELITRGFLNPRESDPLLEEARAVVRGMFPPPAGVSRAGGQEQPGGPPGREGNKLLQQVEALERPQEQPAGVDAAAARPASALLEDSALRSSLKGALARFFVERVGRRPVIVPVILEV